jgi:hypothetical protein
MGECEWRKLSVNVLTSKVMRMTRRKNAGDLDITECNENEIRDFFSYLVVNIDIYGGMNIEVKHGGTKIKRRKVSGILRKILKGKKGR